ncbi:histidine triad nucleotide-binding protein [Patescibacteria group bacterium]
MTDCIFCKIITGEIESNKLYEDNKAVVVKDIKPQAPVHLLVVPNKHIPTLDDTTKEDDKLLGHLIGLARDSARENNISTNGYRVVINCRQHGGQEVDHLHVHILGGKQLGQIV